MRTHKLRYHFVLTLEDGDTVYLSELGVTPPLPESVLRPFNVPSRSSGRGNTALTPGGWMSRMRSVRGSSMHSVPGCAAAMRRYM